MMKILAAIASLKTLMVCYNNLLLNRFQLNCDLESRHPDFSVFETAASIYSDKESRALKLSKGVVVEMDETEYDNMEPSQLKKESYKMLNALRYAIEEKYCPFVAAYAIDTNIQYVFLYDNIDGKLLNNIVQSVLQQTA